MIMSDQKPATNTNIRNIYSEGLSYINIRFYNFNLSFAFTPFASKNPNGTSQYNSQASISTTVSYDGAHAIYQIATDIINGKEAAKGVLLIVPCVGGTQLILERKPTMSGQMETIFTISKNGTSIPFRFPTHPYQVKENGQMVTRIVESGLGTFAKTILGYLTGVNADLHLNKMKEDYIKSLGDGNQQQDGGYKPQYSDRNPNFKKNYKRQYENRSNSNSNQELWETSQPNTQNISAYSIQQ
jgi:hypothetical protein